MKIDDWLGRPARVGRPSKLTDAELLTLAVAQVLLGVRSEAFWLRFVRAHLPGPFPTCPASPLQPATPRRLAVAQAGDLGDGLRHRPVDRRRVGWSALPRSSAPVPGPVKRFQLAGWAGYCYCASHSRWFWDGGCT
ncbi:hypothetical protein [Micromonospora sp. 4G55]|uniref:hypothetical protein n=1 Tax=Micromonospora sp. 4G55 TaxID=2806102 RepID=UPI001A3F2B75|nr:hypothetical protein [Micromonospora sp. 4G55]MBM0256070.1 hypothetical protein [Micromonospora sp. 4G55]